jgi:two-component system, OmpR family, sensor histidine kinase SenX3
VNSRRRAAARAPERDITRCGQPTIDTVDAEVVGVLAGLVGLLTGVSATLAFRVSEKQQRTVPGQPAPPPVLPSGVADVLAVLRSSAVVLDAEDQVVRASPTAYSFGLVRSHRLVAPDLLELARKVRRDGEIREAELELPRGPLGGGTLAVLARVAPLGSTLVLILVEDRTEERRVDAVRRDFVANVSHELKTPVGAVGLLAEAVLDAADDPTEVRRFAARILKESTRLGALVTELIALSRLTGAERLPELSAVDVDDLVSEALARNRLSAESAGIEITVDRPSGLEVDGDRTLLVTALTNLLENAIAYSPPEASVSVSRRRIGDTVEIAVTDRGIGIAPQHQTRVFERFFRVDPARSRATGGTGLGLAIVKHVLANHGGHVRLWSSPGTGSTFTMCLPVRAADRSADRAAAAVTTTDPGGRA